MPLDLERPAFQGGFTFPQQFLITMDVATVNVVFCWVVAEQTQIQKIGSAWQKFKGGKISFVERSAIGPNPANAIFFQQPNKLRSMPAGMTKLNRKTEISWQLWEKLSERRLRSEEHTSELQSRRDLVCRLLLEKKKDL